MKGSEPYPCSSTAGWGAHGQEPECLGRTRPGQTEGVCPVGDALPSVWVPSALSKQLEGPPPSQNHTGHAGCICPHSPSGCQQRPCWTEGVETPNLSPLPLCGCLRRNGDRPGGPVQVMGQVRTFLIEVISLPNTTWKP